MTGQPFYPFKSERSKSEYVSYYREREKAWPVPFESRLIETPSGTTHVRASGRPSDPPLVLLHGARVSSLMWSDSIVALAEHHRTYALDILGDGGLSVSRSGTMKPEEVARWLDEVLAVLVPEGTVSLMGISLGGFISGQYALRFPGRVRSVVLLAPGGLVLPISFTFIVRMMLLTLPLPGRSQGPLSRVLYWLSPEAECGDDACRARMEQALADVRMSWNHMSLPAPEWPKAWDDATWRDFCVPCLVVVGEHEKIYSARKAVARLNRVAPQVKTVILPGIGHCMTATQPDEVALRALEFLEEQERISGRAA